MPATTADYLQKASSVVGENNVLRCHIPRAYHSEAGATKGKGEDTPVPVVRPSSPEQVRELVLLAREEKTNLVFFSSSTPRFHTGTTPEVEGVMVDMSCMKKIIKTDRRNKVALIEPGVNYGALINEVDRMGLKVLMPLLPRKGKSVIASYLELEPIQIPKYHWDMTDPLLCTELIFGTGDVFRTGSAAGPGTLEQQWATGGAQKNPTGPAQTDFTRIVQGSQGTMAAVNWASVKLEVKPTIHEIYFIQSNGITPLIDFAYRALRPKLGDEFFILNSFSLATVISDNISNSGDYDQIKFNATEQGLYTLICGVSGYEYATKKRVAYQVKDLSKISGITGLKMTNKIPGCTGERMKEIITAPSSEPYYKNRPKGAFLDIFFHTTMDNSLHFINLMEDLAKKHGYPEKELGIYIQPVQQGRVIHFEFNLYYDSGNKNEKDRVGVFFNEASKALSEAGAYFYRPYGNWAELAYARCPDTVDVLNKIKHMLDPDNILNRGKLCFGEVK